MSAKEGDDEVSAAGAGATAAAAPAACRHPAEMPMTPPGADDQLLGRNAGKFRNRKDPDGINKERNIVPVGGGGMRPGKTVQLPKRRALRRCIATQLRRSRAHDTRVHSQT